jgi:acetylglutamate kinase
MVVVTDVPGIQRKEANGETVVAPSLTMIEIEEMIASGEIYGGMIPKVRAAMQCMQGNVKQVVIVSGTEPGVLSKVVRGMDGGTRIEKLLA